MDRLSTYFRALIRRIWLVLTVFILGAGIAVAIAYLLPPVYESSAKILVESQQIPQDLAQSTVPQGAAERLTLIEQRLMTRDNLLDLVRRLDLFPEYTHLSPSDKIELVRKNTKFENLTFSGGQRGNQQQVSAFTITYRANSPALAARVASEFVTMVLEQNLASRSARASETYKFFDQQVNRFGSELLELEAEISRFKDENGDALPESYQFRLNELSELERQQFELQQRQVMLSEQRRAVERGDLFLASGASLSPEERELQQLRRELIQKRSTLAESHPQITALKASIGALEAAISPLMDDAEDAESADESRATMISNQLEVIDRELALIGERLESGEERAVALRESLKRTPRVEMKLNTLTRRHQTLQAQYSNAIQKLAAADTGQRLEVNRQAERFEVIEQAQVSREPVAPPRMMIAAGGTFGSLALGIALVLGLEIINPKIRTPADLQRHLDLRPMVTIPYIKTKYERRLRILKWAVRLLLAVIIIGGVLWLIDQYIMPLPLLFSRIMDKTGINGLVQMMSTRL